MTAALTSRWSSWTAAAWSRSSAANRSLPGRLLNWWRRWLGRCTALTIETLRAVQMEEPPPLARWRVKVERDLEVICFKCLEKEPRKRYATAEALADDLHRFLTGQAIKGRPVGSCERAAKWVRRRPALA